MSSCCGISPRIDCQRVCVCVYVYYTPFSSLARGVPHPVSTTSDREIDCQCDRNQEHTRRFRTRVVDPALEGIQGPGTNEEDRGGCSSGGGGRCRKAYMRFLHLFRSALCWVKLRGIWRGSYSRYASGVPDLFRNNSDVFVFLREEPIMHTSARSFTPTGGRRQEPRGV